MFFVFIDSLFRSNCSFIGLVHFSQKDLNRNDETLSFYYLINVIIIMFKKHVVEEIEV